jgi:hypothetical protein
LLSVFHSQPVKQRPLRLLLAGGNFGQVPTKAVGLFLLVTGPTYGLTRLRLSEGSARHTVAKKIVTFAFAAAFKGECRK